MTSLMVPSFYPATLPTHHHAAVAYTEVVAPVVAPWRRILAVEPDLAVLHAKSLLLTKANYCVTRATGDRELFHLRDTKPVALAILSDRLGPRLLGNVAETVRRLWPRTRILILGQAPKGLEDYLYDEQLSRYSDSQQVLANLESLYSGMWNQRSSTLDWNARSARCFTQPSIKF